ncbi:putative benzoate 4-monooxygenase cytochrome p450 protein [Botrytis fragariae]|uniref:Putative benzoate 4-monooxygenase cytochrome p450 protein n=1 Tax=Botrytis fragariae TaxID=1964551 RepID=A0A8H6ANY3_9HELO|nr:putative benzoate 4-monooxygenase cytochrome p450 protein [Botrytis fragariae]KAF5870700.1 putative benzoate 4-monooxygenase cytochrome p450 protein [Botrytis fragariae]
MGIFTGEEDIRSNIVRSHEERMEEIENSQSWAEAMVLLSAGGTALSTLLSAPIFYLSHSYSAYKVFAHESHAMFSNTNDVIETKRKECRFLEVVVNEALGIASPVPGKLWRDIDYSEERSGADEKTSEKL